jgi:hypothetical protein
MRALAEYVMRGRTQALWVSVLGASSLLFAWISAAVIALVTLRRGEREGVSLLAWAALPAGFLLAMFGDVGPLGMIVGTTALAVLLRKTVSWQAALLGSVVVGGLTGLGLVTLGAGILDQLVTLFAEMFENMERQLSQGGNEVSLQVPARATIAGMLGLLNAVSCVMCLVLARYWQALLYNPGGFREEFHALRLPPVTSLALVLAMVLLWTYSVEFRPWSVLFAIPLSVAGLAFVHARAARRGLGGVWLGMFYVLWVLIDPVKLIVIGVAVADSLLDFRRRWPPDPNGQGGPDPQDRDS